MKYILLIAASLFASAADTAQRVPTIEDLHKAKLANAFLSEITRNAPQQVSASPIPLTPRGNVGPIVGAIAPQAPNIKPGEGAPTKAPKSLDLTLESAWGDESTGITAVVSLGEDTREMSIGNFIGPWKLERIDPGTRCFHFSKTSYVTTQTKKKSSIPYTETKTRCANRATAVASATDDKE